LFDSSHSKGDDLVRRGPPGLGKGDGTFQPALIYDFGDCQFASGIAAGDFNGDYTMDLVMGGLGTFGNTTASVLFNIAGFYLYVAESGTGGGSVTSSPPGINCGRACAASFAGASRVTLTATPNSTSNFTGWSGVCSGTGTCAITMKAAENVAANFAPQDFSLKPASTTMSVAEGGQNADVLTLIGVNGPFSGAIQLTCTIAGPAPMPTCALSATSVTPGANSVTSTMTISASSASARATPQNRDARGRMRYALWMPLLCGIVLAGSKKRRRQWVLFGALLLLFFLEIACGGGSSAPPPPTPKNYMVTVTAASGAITHTTQVAVTVE